ncbi:alpha/beta hydrolase [Novispirillum itersonii]|uniref:Acetyl esterase/lipase n=1 Tax=Novispirillum itersonii TaxID=189 RepID=A0A7W9ZI58_NOVIT|nr:alpha/beta hydrolase [Novispirillum itersonii]MBB6210549.1 acetyl esterase/lipase [Novispirillum itersonii]
MQRRHFLRGLGISVLSAGGLWPTIACAAGRGEEIRLWQDEISGGGGPLGGPVVSAKGAWTSIRQPVLRVLSPSRPNGQAVLIAAGGGYTRIEVGKEAEPAARWLTARGYTAYILIYRLPGEGWADGPVAPLQDALRALQVIRQRQAQVSVLGFSAGGHLLGVAAFRPGFQVRSPRSGIAMDRSPVSGAALIYPVVSLLPPNTHTSTYRQIIGRGGRREEAEQWSLQTHVTGQAPPLFLVQAEDDAVVAPESSRLLSAAYQVAGVPVEMIRYPTGGHGFAMGRAGDRTQDWPQAYAHWLEGLPGAR